MFTPKSFEWFGIWACFACPVETGHVENVNVFLLVNIHQPWTRLAEVCLWRDVDREHNRFIAQRLIGEQVLDLGCGYGSLVNYLNENGWRATGIDLDPETLQVARKLFPSGNYESGDFVARFESSSFDHIVMRDSWHHIYEESEDPASALREIRRLLKPGGSLVVFDPNLTWILRFCRWLAQHEDAECSVEDATRFLETHGFTIVRREFFECFALPLSGGYVGPVLLPNWAWLNRLVIEWNFRLSAAMRTGFLGRSLLWRYCLVAQVKV